MREAIVLVVFLMLLAALLIAGCVVRAVVELAEWVALEAM